VNNAIQQLNQVTQQNAASSEELATSAEELSSQADQLKQIISYFKIGDYKSELQDVEHIDFQKLSEQAQRQQKEQSSINHTNKQKTKQDQPVQNTHKGYKSKEGVDLKMYDGNNSDDGYEKY
jgi:methyl-accepting chemotaxis protein